MRSYTILIMRRNETARKPLTLHISARLLWSLLFLAVALPVGGFLVSAGVMAPAWMELNFNSMKQRAEKAEEMKGDYAEMKRELQTLKKQLDEERKARAEAEAKGTMAETARAEATSEMTRMEGELLTLKRSVATYEKLLKPKLERELLQCVNLHASAKEGTVSYGVSFAKLTQTAKLPDNLVAHVRVVTGDNAVDIENSSGKTKVMEHAVSAKDLSLKGTLDMELKPDTTRLIDVKVFDASDQPVGYCWKTF